jgi:hypothetical protein
LICKESKSKSDVGFILPGQFSLACEKISTSPVKLFPKKPSSLASLTLYNKIDEPEIQLIMPNGLTSRVDDRPKLLQPFEYYNKPTLLLDDDIVEIDDKSKPLKDTK